MKYLKILALATIVATAALGCGNNQQSSALGETQVCALDSLFASIFPDGEPGGAVLIMKDGNVIYDKGFGLATLSCSAADSGCADKADCKIDGNTFFNIASCSKQFTAVAVLQLAQKGLINLDDNVNKYLTEYTDPIWDSITVHHLLSHTSGIPDEKDYLTREQKLAGDDDLSIEYLATLDHLSFRPGERFEYMNPTYVLLSQLVARVSGKDFRTYVRENLFDVAGMEKACYFCPDDTKMPAGVVLAHGYKCVDGEWQESDYGENTFFATGADGGICTSTRELACWEKALANCTVLNQEWLDTAWTPRIHNSEKSWYCYGWGTEGEGDEQRIYHTGGNGGFKTYIVRYPATGYMFVVLANRNDWDIPQVQSRMDQIVTGSEQPRAVLNF